MLVSLMPTEKIAKILRADKRVIQKIEARLSFVTGKKKIFEKIVAENESHLQNRLLTLGVPKDALAKELYDALISKIESDDFQLSKALDNPLVSEQGDCARLLQVIGEVVGKKTGFFLKKEKAVEFLRSEPPKRVMEHLGYSSVDAMLDKEDLLEIYCALRFVEGNEWLNNVFFKQYGGLKPEDFEEREIVLKALPAKWSKDAQGFALKKHHNISHLKELGVVFVLPVALGISGELLRMISLILHYLHEIPFYSDLFKRIAEVPELFSESFISLLRGDVIDRRLPESEKSLWFVIQRYLSKDDDNDWRLFSPHINPESIHWSKAEADLVAVAGKFNNFGEQLEFWRHLDWVGDYFKDDVGNDVLVSLNLIDTVMSLVKQKELHKYLYHHQEALWNKIFIEYFSRVELEKFCKDYLLQGYFEI